MLRILSTVIVAGTLAFNLFCILDAIVNLGTYWFDSLAGSHIGAQLHSTFRAFGFTCLFFVGVLPIYFLTDASRSLLNVCKTQGNDPFLFHTYAKE